jgi:membrane-associated phospholipid phosphatase
MRHWCKIVLNAAQFFTLCSAVICVDVHSLCAGNSTNFDMDSVSTIIRTPVVELVVELSPGKILERDGAAMLADAGSYFTAPLRFGVRDWLITGATLGGTATLIGIADEAVRNAMLQNRSPLGNTLSEIGNFYGLTYTGVGIGAALYVAGLAADNADVRVTGRLVFETLLYGGAVNLTLKSLFGRSRPYTNDGATTFRPVQTATPYTSLPSGHATVAFAISSVLAERVGNPWLGAGLYALAGITTFARMYSDAHWGSDVLLGAAIGAGAGLLLCHLEREREWAQVMQRSVGQQLFISPTLNGFALTYYFK